MLEVLCAREQAEVAPHARALQPERRQRARGAGSHVQHLLRAAAAAVVAVVAAPVAVAVEAPVAERGHA